MLRAQDIATGVAALLNDQGLSNNGVPTMFTYTAILPYMNMALAELRETLENYNIGLTNKTDISLVVPIGTTSLDLTQLPSDFVECRHLWERTNGQTNEDWLEMSRRDYLPPYTVQTTCLVFFTFNNQSFEFIGATSDRNLRLDYIATVMPPITDPTDPIVFINAESFLKYRTGALAAQYIGENETRAQELDGDVQKAYDRFLQINTKARQSIAVRRRPFMRGYKSRGGWI